jgi:hypothetical protein
VTLSLSGPLTPTPLVFPTMSIMDHRLICQWLHLPPESWPPDPYRLVGIEPAALTHALLEERVQERIQIVRRYQLVHPDECTEAMNRLAQAYVSLAVSQQQPVAAIPAPVVGPSIPLESLLPPPPAPAPTAPSPVAPPQPKASTAPAPGMPSNRRTIYHRLARVRRLLRAWRGVEHYLGDSGWRIARPTDADALAGACAELVALVDALPRGVGRAGEPGYLVMALARQQVIVSTFQALLPSQREALARDWSAGMTQLEMQLAVLRSAARALRKKGSFRRSAARVVALLFDRPELALLLLGCLALLIAIWRTAAH